MTDLPLPQPTKPDNFQWFTDTLQLIAKNSEVAQSWSSVVQAVFAVVLAVCTIFQIIILFQQTKILKETKEISIAALGRPYLFFEFLSHNLEEWRQGKDWLHFNFQFTNHGVRPAVIRYAHSLAILSQGRYPRDLDAETFQLIKGTPVDSGNAVWKFPRGTKEFFLMVSHKTQSELIHHGGADTGEKGGGALVLRGGETSRVFRAMVPYPALKTSEHDIGWQVHRRMFKLTENADPVAPWLLGSIDYEDTFGGLYHTNFCVHSRADGTAVALSEHPYTERT